MLKLKDLLFMAALLAFLFVPSCGKGDAEDHALEYARKLGNGYRTIGCTDTDSDDDGYVSCTIMHPDGGRSGIQCATGIASCASGCKEDSGKGYSGQSNRY